MVEWSGDLAIMENLLRATRYEFWRARPGQETDEDSTLSEVYQMWQTSEDGWRVHK